MQSYLLVNWQKILAQGFASSSDLLRFLELPLLKGSEQAEKSFATRVPRGFAERMQKKNPSDPLLLQVLAIHQELMPAQGYIKDPLQENHYNPIEGLIHKYKTRVLLTVTGACAIHCRYCFRRHFSYQKNNPGRNRWQFALEYIKKETCIKEVIFSGGDPLLATDATLAFLLQEIRKIQHIQTIRIHTRIPIVLPERITSSFLSLFAEFPLQKVMVLHCNHPQEIDTKIEKTCALLQNAGFTLLNQSVLLKNINDKVQTLALLSERLFSCKILPYYLHLMDKVEGAAHFDIPRAQALALYQQLQSELPGYLLPRLAQEEPGKTSKTLITPYFPGDADCQKVLQG